GRRPGSTGLVAPSRLRRYGEAPPGATLFGGALSIAVNPGYCATATRLLDVLQYHTPSTSAGDASTDSPSELVCSSLNSRPAFTTNVSPSSFVKNSSPLTATGDAEKPSRCATPRRP